MTVTKLTVKDLALLGGTMTFEPPRSIGSLADPDPAKVLKYSRIFYDQHRYTNSGPVGRLLEDRLATWHQTERCVTFSSAFWGISLAIRDLALPDRLEVVTPSLTYRRMGEIIASAGMTPRFCDVDPDTLAQTAATTRPCLNASTALILGAHPTINCCDCEGLENLSADTGVPLLFDSVESAFETSLGRRIGTFGRAEVFSIHATKLVNGFEGGYLVTNDRELADRLIRARGFGISDEDQVSGFGINAKLNEIHAAMAMASLDDLPELVERNHKRYLAYRDLLDGVTGLTLRQFDEREQTSFKNILVRLEEAWPLPRSDTLALLQAEGALARPYYAPPLHTRLTDFDTKAGTLPVTEQVSREFVLLPCGDQMSVRDIRAMVDLLDFLAAHGEEIAAALAAIKDLEYHSGYDSVPLRLAGSAGNAHET